MNYPIGVMIEHPYPYLLSDGRRCRWWFRELGIGGPWTSEFSFNRGRTWNTLVLESFRHAKENNELEIVSD